MILLLLLLIVINPFNVNKEKLLNIYLCVNYNKFNNILLFSTKWIIWNGMMTNIKLWKNKFNKLYLIFIKEIIYNLIKFLNLFLFKWIPQKTKVLFLILIQNIIIINL